MKNVISKFKYTCKHWVAFQKTALTLKRWKFKYLFHDIDKLVFLLIFLDTDKASSMHQRLATHHPNNIFKTFDPYEAIIDWECARFTKPDKPLTARQTLYKYYPEFTNIIIPILDDLKI